MGRGNSGFLSCGFFFFYRGGVELDNMTDYLIVVDQKIPADWLINITFLGKVETAIAHVLNLCLVARALAQLMPFWVGIFSLHQG